jgi:fructokinase
MILSCGEALIDMLPRNLEDGSSVFLPVAGGAVFNTAIALGRLGETAGFLSGVSTDFLGSILEGALRESNVDASLLVRSDRPTTLAFVRLRDGHAEYAFYDENTAGRMLQPAQLPQIPADVQAMHFGAISLIGEPCGSAYEALALREAASCVISLDPNVRAGFVRDEAVYRARLNRMIAVADIIKVSDEDLAWLAPGKSFEDVAQDWLSGATELAVMTRGARGAVAVTRAGRAEVDGVPVTVADTVGAGDTFNAGLLAGLRRAGLLDKKSLHTLDPDQLKPALELAARAAAITVSRTGANPPWAHEIGA